MGLAILLACAVFFYRAADFEELPSPLLWALASAALSFVSTSILPLGLGGALGSQLLLFIAFAIAVQSANGSIDIPFRRPKSTHTPGRCVNCHYDLGCVPSATRCPDCGRPIPATPRTRAPLP